jgi:16S rRNA (uracil1498-N3)-methyltransferase
MSHKKIHRFMMSSPIPPGEVFEITDERIVHQVGRVLKMEPGEVLAVFNDGTGDTIGRIESIDKTSITVEKLNDTAPIVSKRTVIAAVAIPKGDTFELITQKLTELGVSTIVPLITSRTIKQSVRLDRLQTISDEAVEQCGGNSRVTITEPVSIQECLAQFPFPSIAFEPGAAKEIDSSSDTVVMYVGPEGGWSEDDMELLKDVTWVSLGERILRTETAAIVGVHSILQSILNT